MAKSSKTLCAAVGAIAACLAAAGGVRAADAPPAPTDQDTREIIVTAQKRSENVQQVPISVTVISADQLTRRGVQGIQDLSQASASLEFTAPSAAPGGGAFVRGIGTNQLGGATVASSVSLVLDGVVLGNANVSDLFDTERVEVLKGPQGTLFGSSVSAGVINITTKAPKIGETSGYFGGELTSSSLGSQYTRRLLRGAINLPVSDTSALRVAIQTYANSGMTHDAFTGTDETANSYAVRARYLANIGSRVTFNLIGDYDRMVDDDMSLLTYRAVPAGSPLAQALAACGVTVSVNNVDSCQSTPTFSHASVGGVSGQFDVTFDGATLTSISSWRERYTTSANNIIGIDPATAGSYLTNCLTTAAAYGCLPVRNLFTGSGTLPQRVRNNLVSQELRLTSEANHQFEWVAGLYFQHTAYSQFQPGELDIDLASIGGPSSVPATNFGQPDIAQAHTSDYAAFGNATWYPSPDTRVIAGLRYTHSTVWETAVNESNDNSAAYFTNSGTANALTWRLGLQHDLARGSMVYATVSTGYKAPEINDALTVANIAPATYTAMTLLPAERPTNYEIGIKQSMFGNKLYVDADVFYTDVRHYQAQSTVPGPGGLINNNVSVPSIKSKGIEWEIFGHPLPGTNINVSGIYNVAKYPLGFLGADGADLGGHQLNYAPKFKMSVSLEQEVPLSERYKLVVGGDATIRSSQSMYLSSDPVYVVSGTTLFNARVSLRSSANWSVSLFGRNLGNKVYPTQLYPTAAFATGGIWQVLDTNSRRTVGFQFEAKF